MANVPISSPIIRLFGSFKVNRARIPLIGVKSSPYFGRTLQCGMAICLMSVVSVKFVEDRFLPEIEAVNIAMAEVQGPLMRLESRPSRLAGHVVADGKSPGDDLARGCAQRHQIRLRGFGTE